MPPSNGAFAAITIDPASSGATSVVRFDTLGFPRMTSRLTNPVSDPLDLGFEFFAVGVAIFSFVPLNGAVQIDGGSRVSANIVFLGRDPGTDGSVDIRNSGSLLRGNNAISVGNTGRGVLGVGSGAEVTAPLFVVGDAPSGEGFVFFDGGSAYTGIDTIDNPSETVGGGEGLGRVDVINQSTVTTGLLQVGVSTGSDGRVALSDANSRVFANSLVVGSSGLGVLEARNGAQTLSNTTRPDIVLGENAGSRGELNINAGSSSLTTGADTGEAVLRLASGATGVATVGGAGAAWAVSENLVIGISL
ncbi:MAG: hypothetical protein AAGJ46_09700 [Planctomycetota bacterium]